MFKRISAILALIIALAAVIVLPIQFDNYVAKASDLAFLDTRFELKLLSDEYFEIQKRVWALEEQCKVSCNSSVVNEIRILKLKLNSNLAEQARLRSKYK